MRAFSEISSVSACATLLRADAHRRRYSFVINYLLYQLTIFFNAQVTFTVTQLQNQLNE